ncbi:ribonuclease H-like domain-containing protein [Paenibacillus qinlingensis]|uniref:ribonuclease H-like domain-containing protein n=1 Tax=Paenibacillus qinlingensis TaxID=1837343 RepID=UPI0015644A90|nr:ribonuclease H-like domain-containing protein [Paenibacillus qinlingensis]NQX63247.1 ribonuclease H-like domain-containing protein [Paenibacillus qinlingensis]
MSGLRERLGRLRGPAAAGVTPPPPPEAGGEWAQLGAHIATSPAGSFVMRRRQYGADSVHGNYRLRELADVAAQLSCFHERDAVVRLEELLFFDTETTGLGVGAGNVPFMVGIGYYTGELFTVEQLMIRNPAEEHAMLVYLQELLGRYTHIVSYNGRTFDWPILKNRFVLNRLKLDDSELLQLDLLYASRSLWRNTLPSCRLSKVEESRLGFERVDDVPGSMAPALYFQYLAEKDPAVLQGVFIHNEHDIVTLAALTVHFGNLLRPDENESDLFSNLDVEELFRTGLWLDKMARPAKAEQYFNVLYEKLLNNEASVQSAEQETALLQLAHYYKKIGQYNRALELWKQAILLKPASISLQLEPYLELAMYYEHREKDLSQAVFYAEEAWARLWRRRALHRGDQKINEIEEAWEKRLARLQQKMRKKEMSLRAQADSFSSSSDTRKITRRSKKAPKPTYVSEGLI